MMSTIRSWKDLPAVDPRLAPQVISWWSEHGRDFEWRHTTNAFRILCTEIMLQRTRAAQVVEVYREYVEEWSGPESVRSMGFDAVEGVFGRLGLTWRAKYFWDLQEALSEDFDGEVPCDWDLLRSLPGVGEYVATAVLVFAFGERRTVVDSNVLRILGRYYGMDFPNHARRSVRVLRWASEHAPATGGRCRSFNWGLLDLGAEVCTPFNPAHRRCPLDGYCLQRKGDRVI